MGFTQLAFLKDLVAAAATYLVDVYEDPISLAPRIFVQLGFDRSIQEGSVDIFLHFAAELYHDNLLSGRLLAQIAHFKSIDLLCL